MRKNVNNIDWERWNVDVTNVNIITTKTDTSEINIHVIDRMLWLRVRKAALDSGTTATEFVESALNEKLAKVEAAQG